MKEKIVWGMIGCGDVTEVKNGPGRYVCFQVCFYRLKKKVQKYGFFGRFRL